MKKRTLLYIICVMLAAVSLEAASGYQFRHLPADMHLSSKLINAIYQDDDGFVYFGTASGLDRYDGYSVRSYARDDSDSTSLHDSFVEEIQRAPDGRIWVRAGGSYSIFDPRTERFNRDVASEFRTMGMTAIPSLVTFGPGGSCWMYVAGDGLYHYRNNATVRVDDPDGLFTKAEACTLVPVGDSRVVFTDKSGRMVFVDARTSRISGTVRVPGSEQIVGQYYSAYADREGLVWMYSTDGLWLFGPDDNTWYDSFGGTRLPQGHVMDVMQDRAGRMWIGFDHSGLAVMEKNGRVQRIVSDGADERTLGSNTVTVLMEDRMGTIWAGSRKSGVSLYNDNTFKFDFTPFPDVNCIAAGTDGALWLGTDSKGLFCWDRGAGSVRNIDISRAGRMPDAVVSIAPDSAGNIWAGTFGGGLLKVDRGGHIQRLTTADGLTSDNIWAVRPMADGTLMLATLGGGAQRYDPVTRVSTVYSPEVSDIGSEFVNSIAEGPDGKVYMATANGMSVLNPATGDIENLLGNRAGTAHFLNPNVNQVMCDSRGLVWLATREGLNVYDVAADSVYTPTLGPARRFVLGVAEDANHAVWVSVGSELVSVAVSPGASGDGWTFDIHSYDSSDGLQTCDFNQRSLLALPGGDMMVGGFYGVNSFRPDGIKFNTMAPRVYFTRLMLFNEEVRVGDERDGRVLLPERLSRLEAVELDYSDNEFAVAFATDNYVNPEKTVYYYRLDGFSEDWRMLPDNANKVAYTNLAPGRYTLRVKACSGDGVASSNVASLGIVIRPPFYATPLAKFIYVVLALALAFGAFRLVRRHERRLSRRRERREAALKQEELDQLKFRFFTNVSHELRTPLTLITAPLDSLLKKPLDDDMREKLELIHGNADRLMRMVNQLLDFRKNEVAGLTLNPSRGDIVRYVRSVCDSFLPLAEAKHIHLTFFSSVQRLMMDFDEDMVAKIVINILGNAFKFTPSDGRVDVALTLVDNNLEITIADTGCGISDADKKRIFERFYQGGDGRSAGGGTGIGLSLVAEFVRLHGGTVAVADSAVRGAVFTVTLPVRGGDEGDDAHEERPAGDAGAPTAGPATGIPRLLVVDDNPDLLRFMSSELSGDYAVVTAADGNEALAEVARYRPDIVISDLMMPGMDGIELCRRLKSDPATAGVPLLILTAKHEVSAKIEGLTLGADDYMTKPFNIDVLRLRLKKLLDLRGRGAQRALIDPEPQSLAITSLDEQLIERAVRYVDDNMNRPDLSVEELAAELGMSRVHLYKRLKQITGKTPIEFIRVLRLKRAAQLLRESQLNISEIAYRCGFNNPKYFSRYFKEEFGVLPSVYQEKEGK